MTALGPADLVLSDPEPSSRVIAELDVRVINATAGELLAT